MLFRIFERDVIADGRGGGPREKQQDEGENEPLGRFHFRAALERFQFFQQLAAEAVEAAVGHDHDHVAGASLGGEIIRNVRGGIESLGRAVARVQ